VIAIVWLSVCERPPAKQQEILCRKIGDLTPVIRRYTGEFIRGGPRDLVRGFTHMLTEVPRVLPRKLFNLDALRCDLRRILTPCNHFCILGAGRPSAFAI
jgi:hypothetical protein